LRKRFFAARNMVDIPTWFSTSGLAEQGADKIPLLRSIKKRSKSPAVYFLGRGVAFLDSTVWTFFIRGHLWNPLPC
jgi:hypothetical protein